MIEATLSKPPKTAVPPPEKAGKKRQQKTAVEPALFDEDESEPIANPGEVTEWPRLGNWAPGHKVSSQKIRVREVFKYWNDVLTSEQRKYGDLYIYRVHPQLKRVDKYGKGRFVNPYVLKLNAEDGPIALDMIGKRLGVGIYYGRINQRVTEPFGGLALFDFDIKGSGNWLPEEMPVIEDLGRVDWDFPGNAEYKMVCISRGIYKPPAPAPTAEEQQKKQEGEIEEMAASEVLGNVANRAIDAMMDRPAAAAPAAQDVAGVVTPLVNLLEKQINSNRPPAQQGTVQDQLKGLVELAQTMTPQQADMKPFLDSLERTNALIIEMKESDRARAVAEADRARQEAEVYKAAIPKPKTFSEQIAEMKQFREEMRELIRDDDGDDEAQQQTPAPSNGGIVGGFLGFLGVLPLILEKGAMIAQNFANAMYNSKLPPGGTPIHPGQQQQTTQQAPAEAPEPEQQPTPEQEKDRNEMQMLANTLYNLIPPMVKHFSDQKTGAVFARFVADNYGIESVRIIQSVKGGQLAITGMIQQFAPDVWAQIQAQPEGHNRFVRFVQEFMAYQGAPVN